jgi:hypothetical protein
MRGLTRLAACRPRAAQFHSSTEYIAHLESQQAVLPKVRVALRGTYASSPPSTLLSGRVLFGQGFKVGVASFSFVPAEAPKPNTMTLSLIVPDQPTERFGAVFTKVCERAAGCSAAFTARYARSDLWCAAQNAFPGAPVQIGRELLAAEQLGAVVVNNKISNVCARGDGVADSEAGAGTIAGPVYVRA